MTGVQTCALPICKDTTQEEFFYTFNSLIEEGRQIIISADKSPADLEGIEARLKSRLGCGLVADIHPTDFDLRIGILENKARQLGIELPQKVSEFLASKITSNIRELEGALRRVIAHSQLLSDKEITLDMTQDITTGKVGNEHTESDGYQQQWYIVFLDT